MQSKWIAELFHLDTTQAEWGQARALPLFFGKQAIPARRTAIAPSSRGASTAMEKAAAMHIPDRAQLLPQPPKHRLLGKVLLIILFVASVRYLAPGGAADIVCAAPPAFRRYWHPKSCTAHQRPLQQSPPTGNDEFRLVSVHRAGVGKRRNQVYQVLDVSSGSSLQKLSPFSTEDGNYIVPSTIRQSTRLADRSRENTLNYIAHSRLSAQALRDPLSTTLQHRQLAPFSDEWVTEDVVTPKVSDMNTILTLAKIASNAYIRIPDTEDWYDLGKHWNESTHFGWEENGLRGHVFANSDNSTVIVAMKGTSPPFVGGSDTSTNDKINVPSPKCPTRFF